MKEILQIISSGTTFRWRTMVEFITGMLSVSMYLSQNKKTSFALCFDMKKCKSL